MSIRPKDQKCVVCKQMFSKGRGFEVHMAMHARNGGSTPSSPDVIKALSTIKAGSAQLGHALMLEREEHVKAIAFIDSQIAMLTAVSLAISASDAKASPEATTIEVSA